MRHSSSVLALVALVALACVPQPVEWTGTAALPGAEGGGLVVDAAGRAAPAPAPVGPAPFAPPNACAELVRVAGSRGGERYAVWWEPRADSSARLLAAHSSDGGASWPDRYVVDSLDRGARGCRRPAPAVAADSVNGYVHVSYALDAPEGAGLFYAHLMDPRAQFEPPAAVMYGEGPGHSAVASDGEHVAVAYEDPNRGRPAIGLAISRTAGHTFESKAVPVSGADHDAAAPAVAVRGARVAVGWTGDGARVVRTGRIK